MYEQRETQGCPRQRRAEVPPRPSASLSNQSSRRSLQHTDRRDKTGSICRIPRSSRKLATIIKYGFQELARTTRGRNSAAPSPAARQLLSPPRAEPAHLRYRQALRCFSVAGTYFARHCESHRATQRPRGMVCADFEPCHLHALRERLRSMAHCTMQLSLEPLVSHVL